MRGHVPSGRDGPAMSTVGDPTPGRSSAPPHSPPGPGEQSERTDPPDRAIAADPARHLNRELSWLEFNARVLSQAMNERVPVLERVKFMAIFTSNLDEFFMKRVGLLRRQEQAGIGFASPDGMTVRQQLEAIRARVLELQCAQARCFEEQLRPVLAEQGIHLLHYEDLAQDEREYVDRWFHANLFPVLTPLAVDPSHRFPFISNLSDNLGVLLSRPGSDERHFARVKVPDVRPRFVPTGPVGRDGDDRRLVSIDEVMRYNLADLFPGMTVGEVVHFRVTRSAGVQDDDADAKDVLRSVEADLKKRRFARVVRMEVNPGPAPEVMARLLDAMHLRPENVYERPGPIQYTSLFEISDLDRPDLKDPVWIPVVPARLGEAHNDLFAVIRERDLLLHHPYESFGVSVERFITQASRDPDVLAIKQMIYRTNRESPFLESLIRAAEAGKQVACLVELRARFDEHRNVRFARTLEKAGVHVAYGVFGLKTHSKTALVVRREGERVRCYVHFGTGNYNPSTAQRYTDLSLLTCEPDITQDVVHLFNYLTGHAIRPQYRRLLVAPTNMRRRFTELIRQEAANARAGKPARIWAKVNSIQDRQIIADLYEASSAGVRITLIVRGFCCLRAGVSGLSENIRVISIVGRFLEHSRIFHFADGQDDPLEGNWYIGSADWMYRNMDNRVEAVAPVIDPAARGKLLRIIEIMTADRANAWQQRPDGSYERLSPDPEADPLSVGSIGTFAALMWQTRSAAHGA